MGGPGSTRWNLHVPATLVEDCLSLSPTDLARSRDMRPGLTGVWLWGHPGRGVVAAMIWQLEARRREGDLGINWRWVVGGADPSQGAEQTTILEALPTGLRGRCWLFHCPTPGCGRRCRRLFLPPDGRAWACLACHRLTYRSRREHDARVDALRRDPQRLRAALERFAVGGVASVGEGSLALRAHELGPPNRRSPKRSHPGCPPGAVG